MHKTIFALLFLVLFCSLAQADFTVYLKNGSTRQVRYAEFKGDNVDLYLSTGVVMSVNAGTIDYGLSRIERPTGYGEKVYGPGSEQAAQEPKTPTRVFTNTDVPKTTGNESQQVETAPPTETEKKAQSPLEKFKSNPLYLGILIGLVLVGVVIAISRSASSTKSGGSFFSKAIIIGVIAGGVLGVFKGIDMYRVEEARSRVKAILNGMKPGLENDVKFQTAVFLWAADTAFTNDTWTLTTYLREFDSWRNEVGITTVKEFEITDAAVEKGASPVTVIVSVTIDGQSYKMRVPKGTKISWVQ